MRVSSRCLLLLIIFISCKKNVSQKPDPGIFYARFKINDSAVSYNNNADYYFWQSRGIATDAGGDYYFPTTYISPVAALYSNVGAYYSFGQIFSYQPGCPNCYPVNWTQYGDTIFATGPRKYCYTGLHYVAQPMELDLVDNHSVLVYLNSKEGNLLNSGSYPQPAWSYYSIDTATYFHVREITNINSGNYDKIISGRFACRVFNPVDTADYLDITEGVFRMPIWLNDPF